MNRAEVLTRYRIEEGMVVRSSDGEKLGNIESLGDESFIIEKGFFFPEEYLASYDEISEIRDDEVILKATSTRFKELKESFFDKARGLFSDSSTMPHIQEEASLGEQASNEIRVPVVEEELIADKRKEAVGEVKVRKHIETEKESITVPVTKEEVIIERVQVDDLSGGGTPQANRNTSEDFQETTVAVPVYEEKIRVTKEPRIKEEIRITKRARTESKTLSENVRKERVDIDQDLDENEQTS